MSRRGAVFQDRDVREFFGIHSRPAFAVVGIFVVSVSLAVLPNLTGVKSVWPVVLALIVLAAASIAMVVVRGDPLPMPAATCIALSGPAGTALVVWVLPVPVANDLQTWPIGTWAALFTFLCVRGRTAAAWLGLAGVIGVVVAWSAVTDQGVVHGLEISLISAGPLLMATFFAISLRPAMRTVFELRERDAGKSADQAASLAALAERNEWLTYLDGCARPILERIAAGTAVGESDALECRVVEAHLRDRLRAPALATEQIAGAARRARIRGVTVMLLDDHGLDDASPVVLARVRDAVATHLDDAKSGGRVIVRILAPERPVALTVLVSDPEGTRRIAYDHRGDSRID